MVSNKYGDPQLSHQNQLLTANYKSFTLNSNRSQQIQIAHSELQIAHSKFKLRTSNYKSLVVFSRRRLSRLTFLMVLCLQTKLSDLKMIGVFTRKIFFTYVI